MNSKTDEGGDPGKALAAAADAARGSPKELERISAGYRMGCLACAGNGTALQVLDELLYLGHNARRAAMYANCNTNEPISPEFV